MSAGGCGLMGVALVHSESSCDTHSREQVHILGLGEI